MTTDTQTKLTDLQTEALKMVQQRPRLTVEDYANMMGNTEEVYNAFGYLIYNQYLKIDPRNGAVETKGII